MQARRHVEVKARSATAARGASVRTAAPVARTTPVAASRSLLPKKLLEKAIVEDKAIVGKAVVEKKPAPKKVEEYKVGDKAVYPSRGVAEVVSIEEKDIAGNRQRFYVLRLLDTDHKVYVPVGNATNILRKPISDKEVKEIVRILKVKDIQFDNQTWNRRYRGFMDKIKTGSVFEVAEVLRDLSRLKSSKPALSFGERQMLEKARGLIVKEIAVARGKTEDKVQLEIEAIFDVS